MAAGEFVALMDHDDVLAGNALYEMVKCLNGYLPKERSFAMIYSDEDKIDSGGKVHSRPHFKPDFNLEFLRRNNYFCHFLMFSRELLEKTGGLDPEFDGAQDYDFVLRCVEAGADVRHVPKSFTTGESMKAPPPGTAQTRNTPLTMAVGPLRGT